MNSKTNRSFHTTSFKSNKQLKHPFKRKNQARQCGNQPKKRPQRKKDSTKDFPRDQTPRILSFRNSARQSSDRPVFAAKDRPTDPPAWQRVGSSDSAFWSKAVGSFISALFLQDLHKITFFIFCFQWFFARFKRLHWVCFVSFGEVVEALCRMCLQWSVWLHLELQLWFPSSLFQLLWLLCVLRHLWVGTIQVPLSGMVTGCYQLPSYYPILVF